MRRTKLDRIDRQILSDLQDNGRMTNVELAQRAGISAPPCLRRVRALEESGYIKGYHAEVDEKILGYGVTVFAFVGLKSQAKTDLVNFEEKVNSWPLVRECHMLQGETDFLLKIVARDMESYNRFLTEELTEEENVAHVRSAQGIHVSKRSFGVPIDLGEEDDPVYDGSSE
ncbi:MAG: Lrp/AsnC family transcriptional regulator [Alphaproteobacteria bacterium]|nr:Lrp/AsnC family transcriptional regulator [Alphaproteobacteria bacterium]